MYRTESSRELKTLVLILHGMQDGTEARMMRIDLTNQIARLDETWSLVVDLAGFERAVPAAVREQELLTIRLARVSFRKRLLILPPDPSLAAPFATGADFTQAADFDAAWEQVGGLPRNVPIEAPGDGTRFPANNPQPPYAKR